MQTLERSENKVFWMSRFCFYSCRNLGLLNHMVLTEMQENQKIQPGIQHSRFLSESLTASHFCSPWMFILVLSDSLSLSLLTEQPSVCTFPKAGWQRLFLFYHSFSLFVCQPPSLSQYCFKQSKSRQLSLGMTNSGKILLPWTFKFLDRWHLSRSTDLISILTSKYLE